MKRSTLLSLAMLPLASCGGSFVSSLSLPPLDPASGEALVRVEEGEAHLAWDEPDADRYRVYGAKSKYGSYALLGDTRALSFRDKAYRYGYYRVDGIKDGEVAWSSGPVSAFGSEALIVDERDDLSAVQSEIDRVHEELESGSTGQFSSRRFALLLHPGEYPSLSAKLGYYSSAYGLGVSPDDTRIGELYVSTDVLSNNNATCTFWRNAENLSVTSATQFAVSQATSLRRCHFEKDLALSHPSGWSSGGFLADSKVDGATLPRTQQQWMSRNDELNRWQGSGHNYVFVGCTGRLPADSWSEQTSRTTVVEKTPRVAEMPFLYEEEGTFYVYLPPVEENVSGVSWSEGIGEGRSLPLDRFYLASPRDDAEALNRVLSQGKSIVFTPGIYTLDSPLKVTKENTVLLGLGYATLQVGEDNRLGAIEVGDVGGFRLAGLLLDAGKKSDFLLKLGSVKARYAENPAILSDLFCRLGGKENAHTEVDTMVILNQGDVIGDNFWLWRADHSQGVAWQDQQEEWGANYGNPGETGLRVEGDHVTLYGLMVEHFRKYQTVWNGESGATYMYQSETPYAVPSQEAWSSHEGESDGYASYKVGEAVTSHDAYGLGVYWVHYSRDFLESAIEAPNRAGVTFTHVVTTTFSGYDHGGIRHLVNDEGDAVGEGGAFRALLERYPTMEEQA